MMGLMDAHDGQVAHVGQSDDGIETNDRNDGPEDVERVGGLSAYLRVVLDGWSRYSGCALPFTAAAVLGAMAGCHYASRDGAMLDAFARTVEA
jgi:hypothetical protein